MPIPTCADCEYYIQGVCILSTLSKDKDDTACICIKPKPKPLRTFARRRKK